MSLALGLDIGGSSIKVALVRIEDQERTVVASDLRQLASSRSITEAIELIDAVTTDLVFQFGMIDAIGVGLPGIFDDATGAPSLLPNFPPEWNDFPLRERLERRLGRSVEFVNDAKAFAIAESRVGAGAGVNSVACVVLGTGVGGGVIIDDQLWTGSGTAGEFGHITVEIDGPMCGCGNRGCVEAFAGSDAIAAAAGRATSREAFEAAAAGDKRAQSAIDRAVIALGASLANVFVVLAPELFVVGGGLAQSPGQLIEPLATEIRRRVQVAPGERIKVVPAQLGRNAGAIGAALIAHSHGQGGS